MDANQATCRLDAHGASARAALWHEPVVSTVQIFLPGERTSTDDVGAEVQQQPFEQLPRVRHAPGRIPNGEPLLRLVKDGGAET